GSDGESLLVARYVDFVSAANLASVVYNAVLSGGYVQHSAMGSLSHGIAGHIHVDVVGASVVHKGGLVGTIASGHALHLGHAAVRGAGQLDGVVFGIGLVMAPNPQGQ